MTINDFRLNIDKNNFAKEVFEVVFSNPQEINF